MADNNFTIKKWTEFLLGCYWTLLKINYCVQYSTDVYKRQVKDSVNSKKPQTTEQLKDYIEEAFHDLDSDQRLCHKSNIQGIQEYRKWVIITQLSVIKIYISKTLSTV